MKTQTLGSATRRALFAAAFCAAALPSLADDWTVSENTTLTADTTVDALTVNSGVTLDLAGYSLTCSSLAGTGTITSTDIDLSSPDTEQTRVTWITKFETGDDAPGGYLNGSAHTTTPRNLFDSYTDNTGRILVAASSADNRLPLAVTYDFGVGKKVSKYKIYGESSGNNYTKRSPRRWDLEGSNDNGDNKVWTTLHATNDVTWVNAESKVFILDENKVAAYRYYRIIFREATSGGGYLELTEVDFFGTGELHVNTAEGATATVPYSVTITDKVKVVTEVNGGTVNATGDFYLGKNAGTTGSMTVNSGTVTQTGNRTLFVGDSGTGTLTLNDGAVTMYYVRDGFTAGGSGTINLNGGTLSTQRIYTRSGATGELNFNGGTLKALAVDSNPGGLVTAETSVNAGENGGTIDSGNFAVTVGAAIHGTGAMRFKGGSTITLSGASDYTGGTTIELGTKIFTSDETAKNAILGNLVIDGRARTTAGTGIVVFEYSGLADEDIPTPDYKNCGPGTTVYRDGDTLKVDFVLPVWELAANATWSSLVATYGTPAADAVVRIASSDKYTLTIDTDVTVSQIVFTGTNPDVVVQSGATVTADTISFSGSGTNYLKNDGVVVLNGAGTTTLPFHNDSRGAYYVNNGGRLNVSRVTQGTLAPGFVPEGTNQFVCVGSGAIYDVHGVNNNTASVRLAAGAMINNGSENSVTTSYKLVPQLILDGDAEARIYRSFGLTGNGAATRLDLNGNTLRIWGGGNTYSFYLDNTTVSGAGKVYVESGKLATYRNTHGDSWSVEIGSSGRLVVGNTPTGNTLTVRDFVNNGTDASNDGAGALVVTGTLTPGNNILRLTLADGSTVKASATAAQTVTTAFSASGTVYIDATDIVSAIASGDVPVLTVPANSATSAATWTVSNAGSTNAIAKWRTDESGTTKTLYVGKPTGLMVIFR